MGKKRLEFNREPFYDPSRTYADNMKYGPFGGFADRKKVITSEDPSFDLFGYSVHLPFGIPAGPLLNGRFVKAALDKGFDIVVYKTVRSRIYPCHPWPNVLRVKIRGNLTVKMSKERPLVADSHFNTKQFSITNSFGVPSRDPDVWQKDLANVLSWAKKKQVVIGSFQGTAKGDGNIDSYIRDWVLTADLVRKTGVPILEANLSCPNEGTSHLLCFDIDRTKKIVYAIKSKIGNTPLILKLALFPDDKVLKKFVKEIGSMVEGLAAINTIPAQIVDGKYNQALPGTGRLRSGVCGHAIKWAGLEMVQRLKRLKTELSVNYTIIGGGGVFNIDDFHMYKRAGADCVMSATGSMWNPYLAYDIKKILKLSVTVSQGNYARRNHYRSS